jgi:hypothetical protein
MARSKHQSSIHHSSLHRVRLFTFPYRSVGEVKGCSSAVGQMLGASASTTMARLRRRQCLPIQHIPAHHIPLPAHANPPLTSPRIMTVPPFEKCYEYMHTRACNTVDREYGPGLDAGAGLSTVPLFVASYDVAISTPARSQLSSCYNEYIGPSNLFSVVSIVSEQTKCLLYKVSTT